MNLLCRMPAILPLNIRGTGYERKHFLCSGRCKMSDFKMQPTNMTLEEVFLRLTEDDNEEEKENAGDL